MSAAPIGPPARNGPQVLRPSPRVQSSCQLYGIPGLPSSPARRGLASAARRPAAPASRPPRQLRTHPGGGIEHPTGATDVVLRIEEGGGFLPAEFRATNGADLAALRRRPRHLPRPAAPGFPQVGDGLFRCPGQGQPDDEGQAPGAPDFAVNEGGLGRPREPLQPTSPIDAGNTIFSSTRSAREDRQDHALEMDRPAAPTTRRPSSRRWPSALGTSTRAVRSRPTSSPPGLPRRPGRARSIPRSRPSAMPWPWPDITIADFTARRRGQRAELHTGRSPATKVAVGDLGDVRRRIGLFVEGPDGKTYTVSSCACCSLKTRLRGYLGWSAPRVAANPQVSPAGHHEAHGPAARSRPLTPSGRSVSFAPRSVRPQLASAAREVRASPGRSGRASSERPTCLEGASRDGVSGYPIQVGKVQRPPLRERRWRATGCSTGSTSRSTTASSS